jgi:hypothetical protein
MRLTLLVCTALLVVASIAYSQITITTDEIPRQVGTQWTNASAFSVELDVGTEGGPQTWNFTSQPCSMLTGTEIVDPSSTPFVDSFPTANLVHSHISPGEEAEFYVFMRLVDPDTLLGLGVGAVMTDPDTLFVQKWDPPMSYPPPWEYGKSWHYEYSWMDSVDQTAMEWASLGTMTINAWGTLVISTGTYDCLRIAEYDTSYWEMRVGGSVVGADTTHTIGYTWMTEIHWIGATCTSFEEEEDPEFDVAARLERLEEWGSVALEEGPQATRIHTCALRPASPNPFREATTIRYVIPTAEDVSLVVYDVTGRRVRTLTSGYRSMGSHATVWDGHDEQRQQVPSGIYYCRFLTSNTNETIKVTLIR